MNSKKPALCGLLTALAVVVMLLAGAIGIGTLTGHETAWTVFLNQLRREFPVVQKNAVLRDGRVIDPALLDDALPEMLSKWRQWSYYKLKYQEFVS